MVRLKLCTALILALTCRAMLRCAAPRRAGKEALKSGLNIPGVAESYDEGGNLKQARWAKGLEPGQELPPST